MRPIEESYDRIAKATGEESPTITIAKFKDDWRVSHRESHGQAGTIELAAYHCAGFIEARQRQRR